MPKEPRKAAAFDGMSFAHGLAAKEHLEPLRCHFPFVSYDEIGFRL
jgi:hypothetical protein